MSAFVSPATGPVAPPVTGAPPSVLAPGTPSLAVFVDLMMGKLAPPATTTVAINGERQADADSGKDLPDGDDKAAVDPALVWLFGPMPFQPPEVRAKPLPTDPRVNIATDPAVEALATALPIAVSLPSGTAPAAGTDPATHDVANTTDAAMPAPIRDAMTPERQPAPITVIVPRPSTSEPVQLTPTLPPAVAALPALFALAPVRDREAREGDAVQAPVAAAASTPAPIAVAPTADAQRQSLDMSNRDWPQKMIDRIEALRDDANAADTSIRLKPEALGRVDVALKSHADGAISVHFIAEQPATRTLLIDAAPQLAATAEARGIRLSGTSVDLGGQGGGDRGRSQFERQQDITNHLAASRGEDSDAVDDGRIA